ncbi:MAG: ester cyclase [Chloroflexota bacterium]
MTASANEAVIRRLFDGLSRSGPSIIDELYGSEFIFHPKARSPEAYKQRLASMRVPFGGHASIDKIDAEGDEVRVQVTWRGTHQAPFRGIEPSGRPVTWTEFDTFRVADGKVVEQWHAVDMADPAEQLGAALPLGKPGMGNCERTTTGYVPLPDLSAGTYEGFEGGLYPGGSNRPPAAYAALGLERARHIVPRDDEGHPDPRGKIVLLSIGMSNTHMEYEAFKRLADADDRKHPRVVLVDGAQGSQAVDATIDSRAGFWAAVDHRLVRAGATPAHVQAVWLKQVTAVPREQFPDDARHLQVSLRKVVGVLRQRFPNLQIVYLSSRIYAGYATTPLSPEPSAYQSGFAMKWLIEEHIDATAGGGDAAERPWLAWGPYLWTDGLKGRSDGLIWECRDCAGDGTHPSATGVEKVAQQLLEFFTTDETATPWFTRR